MNDVNIFGKVMCVALLVVGIGAYFLAPKNHCHQQSITEERPLELAGGVSDGHYV